MVTGGEARGCRHPATAPQEGCGDGLPRPRTRRSRGAGEPAAHGGHRHPPPRAAGGGDRHFLALPLVLLKLASTGYRAVRYYAGTGRYRQAGPPRPFLRLLAPVLVVSTVVLFLSGVVMWVDHSRAGLWSTLHTDAAVVFCAVVAIHLLAYLPGAWRTARAARSGREDAALDRPARTAARRRGAVLGAVVVGLVLAVATVPTSVQPQRGPERHHDHAVGVAAPPSAAALTPR
jgi:hypothetical protein